MSNLAYLHLPRTSTAITMILQLNTLEDFNFFIIFVLLLFRFEVYWISP